MCLKRIIFLKKRPKVILLSHSIAPLIFKVSEKFFPTVLSEGGSLRLRVLVESELFIFSFPEPFSLKKINFWVKHSSLPILSLTTSEQISGEMEEIGRDFPSFGYLVLNFDDEKLRELSKKRETYVLTFGFEEGADLRATDYHFNDRGVSFKLNFNGNMLPIWLADGVNRKKIYDILALLAISQILNLNLVEVSKILRDPLINL